MHKKKICQILVISLILLIFGIYFNVTSINVNANTVKSINTYSGASRTFLYDNEPHVVTYNQLDKKLNTIIYLLKNKNRINFDPTLFSLGGINLTFKFVVNIVIIMGISLYLYKKHKLQVLKRRKKISKAITLLSNVSINIYKLILINKSLKVKCLLFVRLICYLNMWSKYCLKNLDVELLYRNMGDRTAISLKILSTIYQNKILYRNTKHIRCLCAKFYKYRYEITNNKYDFIGYIIYMMLYHFKCINVDTHVKVDRRELRTNLMLGYMDAFEDFYTDKII